MPVFSVPRPSAVTSSSYTAVATHSADRGHADLASRGEIKLELSGIHHAVRTRRSTVDILRGVDLVARAGEVTALLGPNGAGKTTTLTIAQGLLRPTQGRVRLLGQDPWRAGAGLRSRVGVMLQDGGLPLSATPDRLLRHVTTLYRDPVDMPALMDRLGIQEFARRDIRRLSGGQRQRVALAAALAGRPQVVFLDEPSAGLDPVSRQLVFDLIRELRSAGVAIILTTHLLDDAQRLADQVVLLRQGQVERAGTVSELTRTTGTPALHFRLADPVPAAALESVPAGLTIRPDGASSLSASGSAGSAYVVDGAGAPEDLQALAAWWTRHALMPTDLHMARRSLEDVFMEVAP